MIFSKTSKEKKDHRLKLNWPSSKKKRRGPGVSSPMGLARWVEEEAGPRGLRLGVKRACGPRTEKGRLGMTRSTGMGAARPPLLDRNREAARRGMKGIGRCGSGGYEEANGDGSGTTRRQHRRAPRPWRMAELDGLEGREAASVYLQTARPRRSTARARRSSGWWRRTEGDEADLARA